MNGKRASLLGVFAAAALVGSASAEWQSGGDTYRKGKLVSPVTLIWTRAEGFAKDGRPEFSIDCDGGRRNLHLALYRGTPAVASGGLIAVATPEEYIARVSFDGMPSQRVQLHMLAGESSGTTWGWTDFGDADVARMIEALRAHQHMVVTPNRHSGKGQISLEFDIRGFANAFEPLKRCRLPRTGGRR